MQNSFAIRVFLFSSLMWHPARLPVRALFYGSFLALSWIVTACLQADQPTSFMFVFGGGQAQPGELQVLPETVYSKERGYGFEPGFSVRVVERVDGSSTKSCVTSDLPFLFSVAVPEGNYEVSVTLGDPAGESKTTVKAELRRLMIEKAHLLAGQIETRTFSVNVRRPEIRGGGQVRLKDREKGSEARAWDDRLTLEFDDKRPCVSAIQIKKLETAPVIYVCGDSTVCDQPGEAYASWGQMLTRFFKPDVVIANHGESGESLRGFLGEKRWEKVLSLLKQGDVVLIQMGHNDEKEKGEGVGAFTTFQTDLKRFVTDAKMKGATPVVITPMERRGFDGNKARISHGNYPEAVRRLAKEEHVAMIDLHAMSIQFYEALGPEKAHMAFAGDGPKRDATHHNNYGAYQLAKCIVKGMQECNLEATKSIVEDFQGFDPSKPDDLDTFEIPKGPSQIVLVPLGS